MKKAVMEFLIGLPVVIGVTILLEFLYCTLITKNTYVFDLKICSITVGVWLVVVVVQNLMQNKKKS